MPAWLTPAVTASILGTATLSLAFVFLSWEEKTPFFRIWAWAWAADTARYVFMFFLLRQPANTVLLMGNQICALTGGFLLAWGLYAFLQKRPGRFWFLGFAAGTIWIAAGTLTGFSFSALTFPTFFFLGAIMISAGRAFLRSDELPGAGRTVTGWTFILWGIHKINYPFLRPVEWVAPWGYGITSLLALTAALGMIFAYFRKNKNALEEQLRESERLAQGLKTSEERFRTMADVLPEIIFETDERGNFTYVNRTSFERTGFTPEEVENGLNCIDVIAEDDRARARSNVEKVLGGTVIGGSEYRLRRKDGTSFPALIRSLPIREGNRILGIRGVVTDLTKIKEAEEALVRSQKLDSLAVLAGGIAHDFNNILTGISGHVSLALMLGEDADRKAETLQILRKAERSVDVAAGLAKQLLVFSRGGTPVREAFDLRSVVEEALEFALRGASVGHRLEWNCEGQTVDGDRGQIYQLFTNLALNAQQAMPAGGTVTVTCANVNLGVERTELPPGTYALVTLIDEGVGIPEETLARIFEPYFTTKETGSGLGLAMSFTIVRRHGGWIDVSSQPGVGSIFDVYLPLADRTPRAESGCETDGECRGGRILVMDDEPDIRETYEAMLEALGYEAVSVATGEEMLDAYTEASKAGTGFDAVITDLTVKGGLGGMEAVRLLLAFDADARAIVTSGYSDHDILGNYRSYGFVGVLPKPAKIKALAQILAATLRRKA